MLFRAFLLTLALLPALAAAQDCDCCNVQASGQKKYNAGDWKGARSTWQNAQKMPDADQCPELPGLIRKAQDKIDAAASATRQREKEEAAARLEQEKRDAASRAADDGFWEALKDGDIADCDKYLRKYPYGRHVKEAQRRKDDLAPKPTTTPATTPNSSAVPSGMARIPGGTFTMGDLFGEGSSDETQHSVTVSEFYLGKTEVTFDDFDAFCTATGREKPSDSGWGRGKRPVINVDWYDAVEYCNWLSPKANLTPAYTIDKSRRDPNNTSTSDDKKWIVTRKLNANGYRLPTEDEWEFAAREGGKKVRFGNGKDIANPAQINFVGSEKYKKDYSVSGEYRQKTIEVGSLNSPNALGLHDMSGNVWEWCSDWYGTYPSGSQSNPDGVTSGADRVLRGGSWGSYPQHVRAAVRNSFAPVYRYSYIGFRVARAVSF